MTKEIKTTTGAGYFQEQGRRLVKVPECAKYLGLSPKSIYNIISEINQAMKSKDTEKAKKLKMKIPPYKKLGASVRFDIRQVERFIERL